MIDQFVNFLQEKMHEWYLIKRNQELRSVLGVDDSSLQSLLSATNTYLTFPHASPNVFGSRNLPTLRAARLVKTDDSAHHVRVVLTHNNFSDLGWRPYAYWYLGADRLIRERRYATRGRAYKHRAVESLSLSSAEDLEKSRIEEIEAQNFRRTGKNLAAAFIAGQAYLERLAGLNVAQSVTYIPLPILTEFVRKISTAGDDMGSAFSRMVSEATGRRIDTSGHLVEAPAARSYIFDNYTNIASSVLFRSPVIIGGQKMSHYWKNVEEAVKSAWGSERQLEFVDVSNDIRPACLWPASDVLNQLNAIGIDFSLSMSVAEYGNILD